MGERARWSVRDTASEPTKSGIVGLLACALGINTDEDLQALCGNLHVGVRCDRQGTLLEDYHTICGGVMSSQGKVKKNANTHEPETVISKRYYLCDASFLVAVRAEPDLISRLEHGLQNPVWPIYLGRRSCPPSYPVFLDTGDYPSLESALESWPFYQKEPTENVRLVRAVVETQPGLGVRRRNQILSRVQRTFTQGYTRDISLRVKVQTEEA